MVLESIVTAAMRANALPSSVDKDVRSALEQSFQNLFSLVQDLEFQTGHRIKQVVATRAEIVDAIHGSYPDKALARVTTPAGGLAFRSRSAGPRFLGPMGQPERALLARL